MDNLININKLFRGKISFEPIIKKKTTNFLCLIMLSGGSINFMVCVRLDVFFSMCNRYVYIFLSSKEAVFQLISGIIFGRFLFLSSSRLLHRSMCTVCVCMCIGWNKVFVECVGACDQRTHVVLLDKCMSNCCIISNGIRVRFCASSVLFWTNSVFFFWFFCFNIHTQKKVSKCIATVYSF